MNPSNLALPLTLLLVACGASPGEKVAKQVEAMDKERSPDKLLARGRAFASVGDLTRAEQAVSTLSDKDLEAAAAAAGALQKDLTGEADSVTISITTLLLLVIIVILLAN